MIAINWTPSTNGNYFASAYKTQFFGAISTNMNKLVWKVWTLPKIKTFAWLVLHDTDDMTACEEMTE
jgi:hypothetical protein